MAKGHVCPKCGAEYLHDGKDCGNHPVTPAVVDSGKARLDAAAKDADAKAKSADAAANAADAKAKTADADANKADNATRKI